MEELGPTTEFIQPDGKLYTALREWRTHIGDGGLFSRFTTYSILTVMDCRLIISTEWLSNRRPIHLVGRLSSLQPIAARRSWMTCLRMTLEREQCFTQSRNSGNSLLWPSNGGQNCLEDFEKHDC